MTFLIIPSGDQLVMRLDELISRLPTLSNLNWTLLAFDGSGSTQIGSITDLERGVDHASNGMPLSWEAIKELAAELDDVYNIVLAGYDGDVPPKINMPTLANECAVALQLVDSSFWQCYFRESSIAESLLKSISSARQVDELPAPWRRDAS